MKKANKKRKRKPPKRKARKPSRRPNRSTEADIEAGVAHALKRAFPWIKAHEIQHQTRLSFRVGHNKIDVDGSADFEVVGRCDVLLIRNGRPLAILELKKHGLNLTDEDRKQGLSYARLMDPLPPLVVLTNGLEVQFFETYTGNPWKPTDESEKGLAALIGSAAKLATEDLKEAVTTLLGLDRRTWVAIIRAMTLATLKDLSGPWDQTLSPFPEKLLLPRKVSAYACYLLSEGTKAVIVSGPPLSGKSNTLREVALQTAKSDALAVLMIDAASAAHGVFQLLANRFSNELGWPVSEDDMRAWLRRLSLSVGKMSLVLAIDGGNPEHLRATLDELASEAYGPCLRLLITTDETAVRGLLTEPSGRQHTRLGRLAKVVPLEPLDDDEFRAAERVLKAHRITFMEGAYRAPELRVPWVLRSIAAGIVQADEYRNQNVEAAIPSVPSLDLIHVARERFSADELLLGRYSVLAEAVLDDAKPGKSISFSLAAVHSFVCRFETAQSRLGQAEYAALASGGYIKHSMLDGDERIVVPQVPELLAASVATVVAKKLAADLKIDAARAADSLVDRCSRLPGGEVIGAQAIVEAAKSAGGLTYPFIKRLLDDRPREQTISPGTRVAMLLPGGGGTANVEFGTDGSLQVTTADGQRHYLPADPDEPSQVMYSDITSWLILSHLASMPLAAFTPGSATPEAWLDPAILIEVGSCPIVLRRPKGGVFDGVSQHNVPGQGAVVCHLEGIIEPITLALMKAIGRSEDHGHHIVTEAKSRNQLPLIGRVHIALKALCGFRDQERARWAKRVLREAIAPALRNTMIDH